MGSVRVACASNGTEVLDGHFGSCERFQVYEVSPQAVRFLEARATAEADEAEERNAARAALIGDCQVLFIQSIGGPAAAKVVRAGVHPVKVPKPTPIAELVAKLQTALHSPPPWLAKAMGVEAASLAPYRKALAAEEAA
jgi:nitrogen fixation protein NifX